MILPQNLDSLSLGNSSYSISTWINQETAELNFFKKNKSGNLREENKVGVTHCKKVRSGGNQNGF